MQANAKQTGLIVRLANQLTGRTDAYVSQVADVLPVSKTAASRGLTSEQAGACIDHLKAAIAAKAADSGGPAAQPAATAPRKRKTLAETAGAPTPQQVLDAVLSGHVVDITSAKTGKVYRTAIEGIRREGDSIRILTVDHRPGSIGLDNVAAWVVLA